MFITHSYLGTTKGPYRCLFFLLLEDYIEAQTQFVRELDLELERFARRLGDAAAVVRPFTGDIESTRQQVLDKQRSESQKGEIYKTPSLLMINEDFGLFDPRLHPWIQLHLGQRLQRGVEGVREFRSTLDKLAAAVLQSDEDIFEAAHDLVDVIRPSDVAKVFEAKPGIFGFSIDLIYGAGLLSMLWRKLAAPRQHGV